VCVATAKGTKNLVEVETRIQEKAAGATELSKDVKGKIIEFMWKLKKNAYSETTISEYGYILQTLARRGANVFDPENVKEVIARQETWSDARRSIVVKAYSAFLNAQGISWNPPKYKIPQKLPFIPTEKEVDDLIAGCGTQMATFLQLLKETAARCGEAFKLKWSDIDPESNTVRITPEKSSNPRMFKLSYKLASMLANLPKKSLKVFSYKNKFYLRKTFDKQRKRTAHKLGNPRILQIRFHTLRHWKATMEYHRTKDILHVMQLLGHKNIKNTLIYTQLINFEAEDYVCKTAKSLKEAAELIEAGFEYVTEMEGYKLFRKRK
jgi:integrase